MSDRGDILIQGGRIVGNGYDMIGDLLVRDGRIAAIADMIELEKGVEVFDATGCVVTYGLADVHVHLREPGFSEKETIATGTRAAAHGGFTVVCPMPNLSPAPDSIENLAVEERLIAEQAVVDVRPYATITLGRRGEQVVDVASLAKRVVGFSDDGSGVQSDDAMREAMTKVKEADGIIAAHCEDNSLLRGGYIHDGEYARLHNHKGICSESEWGPIARDARLAAETGCRYHVCHISTAESVDIIRQAKQQGVDISCETAPHYLTLSDENLEEDGRFKMNPPLRSEDDRMALIAGIKDGTIEIIATDHAPHTAEQKSRGLEGSAMGVVGLETSFAVCYTGLVKQGIISTEHLVRLMSENPRRRFRLGGALAVGERAEIAVFDVSRPYRIDSSTFLSKGHSTPFEGQEVYGRCRLTLRGGKKVWSE